MADFKKTLAMGKIGEEMFETFLTNRNIEFVDVRDSDSFQQKDVDYLADGLMWEVKTDSKFMQTGNLAIETLQAYDNGYEKDGWLYLTEADYLVFCTPHSRNIAIITPAKLIELVENNLLAQRKNRDGKKIMTYLLFPYKKFAEHFTVKNIYPTDTHPERKAVA